MLDVVCTHCGKTLKIPEKYLGQKGKCTYCQGEITVAVKPPASVGPSNPVSAETNRVSDAASLKTSEQGPPPPLSLKGIKGWHAMSKGVATLLIAVVVVVGLSIVYALTRADSLESRATQWMTLLDSVNPGADHDSTIRKLCDFIEPSATQSVRAEKYYQERVNPDDDKPRLVAWSVDGVTVSPVSKDKAMVRYGLVYEAQDGQRTQSVEMTAWEKKGGKWCRVQIMPDFPEFKPPPAPAEAITDPPISEAQFQQIQEGMTWEQVVRILGRPGTLTNQSHSMIGGQPHNLDTYEWKWNGGKVMPSSITVNFTNGYVDHTNYRN